MTDVYQEFVRCSEYIKNALKYAKGAHTLEDIWEGVVKGDFHFWPGEKSAVITELQVYPQRLVMHIFLAGGDLDELLEMEKSIEAFARHIHCNSVSISGRRGWLRIFKRDGWEEICTTITKEL